MLAKNRFMKTAFILAFTVLSMNLFAQDFSKEIIQNSSWFVGLRTHGSVKFEPVCGMKEYFQFKQDSVFITVCNYGNMTTAYAGKFEIIEQQFVLIDLQKSNEHIHHKTFSVKYMKKGKEEVIMLNAKDPEGLRNSQFIIEKE